MEIIEMPAGGPVLAKVSYDVYSPEFKQRTVLEWAASGQSQKGFAREHGIPDTTLCGWVKKWRLAGCPGAEGPAAPAPALVEAKPSAGGHGNCSVTVGGATVRFPQSSLTAVIRELLRQGEAR